MLSMYTIYTVHATGAPRPARPPRAHAADAAQDVADGGPADPPPPPPPPDEATLRPDDIECTRRRRALVRLRHLSWGRPRIPAGAEVVRAGEKRGGAARGRQYGENTGTGEREGEAAATKVRVREHAHRHQPLQGTPKAIACADSSHDGRPRAADHPQTHGHARGSGGPRRSHHRRLPTPPSPLSTKNVLCPRAQKAKKPARSPPTPRTLRHTGVRLG